MITEMLATDPADEDDHTSDKVSLCFKKKLANRQVGAVALISAQKITPPQHIDPTRAMRFQLLVCD